MKLKDKAAIVTGASDGIGKAIAIGYAQEGADVAVGYNRSKDKAEQVAEEIRALGRKAVVFRLEIAEMEDAQKMVDEAVDAFDRVDILVNNAGARLPAAIDECPPDLYRQCVNSNLRGVFAAVKAVTPVMIKNGGGKIINITSLADIRSAYHNRIGYTSTKRGMESMTRAMAAELGTYHIYVNSIAPGSFATNMGGLKAAFTDELVKERNKWIPLHFRADTQLMVGPAVFLASADSDYVTGSCLVVDGGWSIVE